VAREKSWERVKSNISRRRGSRVRIIGRREAGEGGERIWGDRKWGDRRGGGERDEQGK